MKQISTPEEINKKFLAEGNHADYLEDYAKMMQQLADLFDAWQAVDKVIPLHSGAV